MKRRVIFILSLFVLINLYAQNNLTAKYKYSTKPMEVMGFTGDSTLTQVRKELENWNVVYEYTDWSNCIEVRNVTWKGLEFNFINFWFYGNGKLKDIMCAPKSDNVTEVEKSFQKIFSELPYRRSENTYGGKRVFYNGKNETENAVFIVNSSGFPSYIEFEFYFNDSLRNGGYNNP